MNTKRKNPRELTLEEFIELETQSLEKNKQLRESNILKLTERMVGASEEETIRLQSLIEIQEFHLQQLLIVDPVETGTQKFNLRSQR